MGREEDERGSGKWRGDRRCKLEEAGEEDRTVNIVLPNEGPGDPLRQ